MYEPLRGCKKFIHGDVFTYDDVKSAVEFYKKYKNSSNEHKEQIQLSKDYPEAFEEWSEYFHSRLDIPDWNDWLFDYCFGDVIE